MGAALSRKIASRVSRMISKGSRNAETDRNPEMDDSPDNFKQKMHDTLSKIRDVYIKEGYRRRFRVEEQ
jgi:hypothetical protein